jgi:hypothetical protein
MYLVAERVVRVRLATAVQPFGLMAAMWRSCGNDRQKDGIARGYPPSRVSRSSRWRRDQCARRHDQQFVISGPLPSWRGKLGGTRTCIPRSLAVRRPSMRHVASGGACDAGRHDHRDCERGAAADRADQSLLLPSGLFERRKVLFELAAGHAGFGLDETGRAATVAALAPLG